MKNTLIDNSTESLSMTTTLKECLAIDGITTVCIATGYWDVPGLSLLQESLRAFLEKDDTQLKLLIGKDPYVYANQVKLPKYKDASYPEDFIKTDIDELDVIDEYKQAVRLLLDFCTENDDDSKIQIRVFRKNENDETQFLHSKCYIFDGRKKGEGYGIVGSSNFTQKGLQGNAELNYVETSTLQVLSLDHITDNKSHLLWFNEKWDASEPWNKQFLEQVLKPTAITKTVKKEKEQETLPFTPYELYIKLLQIKFGDIVDKNLGEQIESYLPSKMSILNYQIEAVKRCISIMHEHGGFMLSDVVGLGKTIVGALLVRHFLTIPEDDGRERRVLIITPPAIQSAWKRTMADFDKEQEEKITPSIDYITTGSIGNLVDDEGSIDSDEEDSGDFEGELERHNYGLIIIDESHKFRNSDTNMYRALDELIGDIYANTGVAPYIGLLSATPQNNTPNDLKNQIYLFERNRKDSTLKKAESGDIEKFFAAANNEYGKLIKGEKDETPEEKAERERQLKGLSLRIRECVLDDILERRTRTDVIKYYADDMEKQHLVFPAIKGPCMLQYKMDDELARLFSDTMTLIAPSEDEKEQGCDYLGYYRYRAIQYFVDGKNKQKYAGRGAVDSDKVADQLARIMQILLVKRLESSFTAFTASLRNLRRYTNNMMKMWENNTIFVCPQIDINKELDIDAKTEKRDRERERKHQPKLKHKVTFNECVEDIRAAIKRLTDSGKNEKGQNAEYKREDFDEDYIKKIKEDHELIVGLHDRWSKNSEDPKFDEFKEQLKPQLFNKETNTAQKLVIFSEAIDTVQSLQRAVTNKGYNVLVITAANRKDKEKTIQENFDANYDGEWKHDYQVIITTDLLAVGINLHRSNVILNYDTPWNSTRLMQRIGRVNRIGSKEPAVYVYNFMPSAQGDAEIQLVRKAHTKLQSFHTLFGEDSKIFSDNETVSHYALKEAVDGAESPMEKYVFELKQFKENNPARYALIEQAKEGWAIASQTDGTAYFLVKAPRSASLAIKIDHDVDAKPQIISIGEMIEAIRVDQATPAAPLPDNWGLLSEEARKAYNQYFVRIKKAHANDKQTEALTIIKQLYETASISKESKNLLKTAMQLARKGQTDIIRKMIALGKQLNSDQPTLFGIEQTDIDTLLEHEIGQIASKVEAKQGEPEIQLATRA